MKVPNTYAEWINCFDSFKKSTNDEETIAAMEKGSIEWTRGVAEKMTQALHDALQHRLSSSSETLQKELDRSKGDESAIVKALLSKRKRLALINRVAQLPAFPEQVRNAMSELITEYAKQTQSSLMDSAKVDRTGRLSMMIKNNSITKFDNVELSLNNSSIEQSTAPQFNNKFKTNKRRVIF